MSGNTDTSQQTTTQTPVTTQTIIDQPPVDDQPNVDEFGYAKDEVPPEEPAPVVEEPAPVVEEPAPEDDTPPEKTVTGYDDKPPVEEPAPVVEEPATEDEKKLKDDLAQSLGNLPDGYDKEKTLQFALANKLTKEQVDAYVKLSQDEIADFKKAAEIKKNEQRDNWHKELYNDPSFGGENGKDFELNRSHVDKLMEKHFKGWKKALTEHNGMLPPYIMKDLLGVYKVLNPKKPLVHGDPSKPVVPEEGTQEEFLKEAYV